MHDQQKAAIFFHDLSLTRNNNNFNKFNNSIVYPLYCP